jgi:hypothetical protein
MTWTITRGNPGDHLIEVIDEVENRAIFKQPRDQGPKKLIEISNELTVYQLATITGIPTAYTCLAQLNGRPGIISVVESQSNWSYITSNQLQTFVINLDSFRALLPFDFWTANTDRRPDHVITKPIGNSYFVYSIDSSHTLNGCTGEIWTSANSDDATRLPTETYNHISEPEIQSYSQLQPLLARVQSLQDDTIASIVDTVTTRVSWNRPSEEVEILRVNAETVKRVLSLRRNLLIGWVRRWCQQRGKDLPEDSRYQEIGPLT